MKIFSKILSIVFSVYFLLFVSFVSVNAAKSAIIDLGGKKNVDVGEKVTVSVTINPEKEMSAVHFYLHYDESVFKYEGGSGVGDAGVIQVEESPGQKSLKCNFTFSAIEIGTCNFSVTDCVYFLQTNTSQTDDDAVSFTGASASLTVKDAKLSSNAKLKSLKVSGFKLSPAFSSGKTSYTLKVPYETKKINVSATTDDASAKVVSVTGNTNLKVGANTVTVIVEAQNGTQKKYTIKVTRLEEEEETESDETKQEEEDDDTSLKTTIDGAQYTIATKIPQEILFKGFTVETTQVNGYDIETAVDSDRNYRIFYLKSADNENLVPYLYDEQTDEFEILKYVVFGENYYIFSKLPDDYQVPETMYSSSINIGGFAVDCLSDSNTEMSDFHYIYCYSGGCFNLYRYDGLENTLQRFPDFEQLFSATEQEDTDNLFSRFSTLSTNGKIIIIALAIVILGIFALLIMLIVYLIRRSINRSNDMILSSMYEDFEEIEIEEEYSQKD